MQHYLIVWTFPTVEGSWESCPGFADYINAGGPGDSFEGFQLKYRVCEPIGGSGVAIAEATDIGKVWTHLGPWIKGYGIQFEVSAVVTDAEFASMWPGVAAVADAEGEGVVVFDTETTRLIDAHTRLEEMEVSCACAR